MTLDVFLALLQQVSPCAGDRYKALCPAHADTHPSLSIKAGETAILMRCWSGCTVKEIMAALKLPVKELFYDTEPNPAAIRKAMARKAKLKREALRRGREIDALREADYFVRSQRGIDISTWTDGQLDARLDVLATAYKILEQEGLCYV